MRFSVRAGGILKLAPLVVLLTLSTGGAAPASATLIGHWALDGDGAALVGVNGTLVNGPTPAADRFGTPGGALSFSGVSQQYMSIAGGGGLNNLQQGTISMFVQWRGTQDESGYISSGNVLGRQGNNAFSNNVIGLSSGNPETARVTWQPYSPFSSVAVTGGTSVGDGVWRHIAITFSPGSHTLYIDGGVDGVSSASGTITNNASIPLTLGAWIDHGDGYSTSLIDDLRIHDSKLSHAEILLLIPEPTTASLLALGLLGFAAWRRV